MEYFRQLNFLFFIIIGTIKSILRHFKPSLKANDYLGNYFKLLLKRLIFGKHLKLSGGFLVKLPLVANEMNRLLIYILVLFISFSCHNQENDKNEKQSRIEKSLNSFIHSSNNPCLFEVSNSLKDTAKVSNIFPIIKTVYLSKIDLTLEFRRNHFCGYWTEIVVCYNESNIYIIPFYETMFRYCQDDNIKVRNLTCLENDINHVFETFFPDSINQVDLIKNSITQSDFINLLFSNLSTIESRKISHRELELLKCDTVLYYHISNKIGGSLDTFCINNTIREIEELQKETRNIIYYFPFARVFYSIKSNNNNITIEIYNKECLTVYY